MGDKSAYTRHLLVEDLIRHHGQGAYTYALERMAEHEGDEYVADMWRKILNELDGYFKQGEGQ
jgi:hypothetical protein